MQRKIFAPILIAATAREAASVKTDSPTAKMEADRDPAPARRACGPLHLRTSPALQAKASSSTKKHT